MLRSILQPLATINEALCNAAKNVAALLLVAMVVIVMIQIVSRYILSDSPVWTEEVARTMMVWGAFLVAPWSYRYGANVRIELFIDELPQMFRNSVQLMLHLLVGWIVIVFLIESFGFWSRGLTVRADSLPIQVAWFYLVVPVCFSMMLLVSVEQIVRSLLALQFPAEDFLLTNPEDAFPGE